MKNCEACNKPCEGTRCFDCTTAPQGSCYACGASIRKEQEPYCAPCFNAGCSR
ncbi:hypothetical protein [Actinosynnema mirum]|uniref:Uncharacterized protein n=1 Tax=Actinosynnema mirum (strain ATCC 29888 / DSM 43827 / JCM 3225 / NBRC 14064 / NCIMB 13271 / NRRL B-12336 / IMRU 3971 / 101) TaxID=446462 RepID=C6WC31_ACTMD|nr:hypothetical protein [Actinosynnema mirum]ACU39419.1 hypothetical protein Amir_5603 [Actinosynnema mirum DSM 43827]